MSTITETQKKEERVYKTPAYVRKSIDKYRLAKKEQREQNMNEGITVPKTYYEKMKERPDWNEIREKRNSSRRINNKVKLINNETQTKNIDLK